MAGMLGRFSTIVKAKMNAALDAAEDPNEILNYSYEQQIEQVQKIRRAIADVVAAKSRLQIQYTRMQQQAALHDAQARQALAANREDLARLALTRKQTLSPQIAAMQAQLETLESQQQQLLAGEQRLAGVIAGLKARQETLKAQYAAAQAQVRISEVAGGLSKDMADSNAALRRIEERTEQMQARAHAIDDLANLGMGGGPGAVDPVQAQLDQLNAHNAIEGQLAAMKAQLGLGTPPPPQLNAYTGPGQ